MTTWQEEGLELFLAMKLNSTVSFPSEELHVSPISEVPLVGSSMYVCMFVEEWLTKNSTFIYL